MNNSITAKAVVEKLITACNERDDAKAWALLAAATVVTVAGSTWLSGRFEGEEQIRRILLATVNDYLHEARVKVVEAIGDGDHVAALVEVSGHARDGASFDRAGGPWGLCFTVTGERIAAIDVFPDTMFIETALCGGVYRANDPARVLV